VTAGLKSCLEDFWSRKYSQPATFRRTAKLKIREKERERTGNWYPQMAEDLVIR
jgi:hypothetical protein